MSTTDDGRDNSMSDSKDESMDDSKDKSTDNDRDNSLGDDRDSSKDDSEDESMDDGSDKSMSDGSKDEPMDDGRDKSMDDGKDNPEDAKPSTSAMSSTSGVKREGSTPAEKIFIKKVRTEVSSASGSSLSTATQEVMGSDAKILKSNSNVYAETYIALKIMGGKNKFRVLVKKTCSVLKVGALFCKTFKYSKNSLKFFYKHHIIKEGDTVSSLRLKDNDVIIAIQM